MRKDSNSFSFFPDYGLPESEKCRLCGRILPKERFYKYNRHGCIECLKIQKEKWKALPGIRDHIREYQRNRFKTGAYKKTGAHIAVLRQSAAKRGLTVDFSKEELFQWENETEQRCFWCGITLEDYQARKKMISSIYAGDTGNDGLFLIASQVPYIPRNLIALNKFTNQFTIDRYYNGRGYSLENIKRSCWVCNHRKGTLDGCEEVKIISKKTSDMISLMVASYVFAVTEQYFEADDEIWEKGRRLTMDRCIKDGYWAEQLSE